MTDLFAFYKPPAWSEGHVSYDDVVFLDEMVRLVSPRCVIEVGVASGCSSAVLLRALRELGGERTLHSYDLLDHCYMAPERPLGAAVDELIPAERHCWRLHPGKTALDAGQEHAGRGVELAFIDADHRHPWPSLDLWALLPALAPGTWVVLHDIALPDFSDWKVFGAQYLFEAWPGEKRASSGHSNSGAIRLPGSITTAREWLHEPLQRRWQVLLDPALLNRMDVPRSVRPAGLVDWHFDELEEALHDARRANRPLLLWGAGSAGRAALGALREKRIHPEGFVDGDKVKHGGYIEDLPIRPPADLASSNVRPFVLVASQYAPQIEAQLRELGFEPRSDYLSLSESAALSTSPSRNAQQAAVLLGMTTGEEQGFLYRYARDEYSSAGAIVDLGCWLGSTTIPLTRGLEAGGADRSWVVHAYDTFVWQAWMDRHAGELLGRFAAGESFLAEFEQRLGPLAARVRVEPGDLTVTRWNGGPIEFLLVDAMKSWELCRAITCEFLPSMRAGYGLVMHQDFKFWACPWIHLSTYRLRDCLVLDRDLRHSTSTVFRLLRNPDATRLASIVDASSFTVDEIDAAYAYWRAQLAGPLVYQLDCARLLVLAEVGAQDRVQAGLGEFLDSGNELPPRFLPELQRYSPSLDVQGATATWQASLNLARDERRPILMWGAGAGGRLVLSRVEAVRSSVAAVIDSDPAKAGLRLDGVPVSTPERLDEARSARPFIVVATQFAPEVLTQLRHRGFQRGLDYCVAPLASL